MIIHQMKVFQEVLVKDDFINLMSTDLVLSQVLITIKVIGIG